MSQVMDVVNDVAVDQSVPPWNVHVLLGRLTHP